MCLLRPKFKLITKLSYFKRTYPYQYSAWEFRHVNFVGKLLIVIHLLNLDFAMHSLYLIKQFDKVYWKYCKLAFNLSLCPFKRFHLLWKFVKEDVAQKNSQIRYWNEIVCNFVVLWINNHSNIFLIQGAYVTTRSIQGNTKLALIYSYLVGRCGHG